MAKVTTAPVEGGRVLICGGTDFATNGRKDRGSKSDDDLPEPHIFRWLSHLNVTHILSGPAANYGAAIDEHGTAHLFGKLPSTLDDTAVPAERVVSVNDPIAIRATLAGAAKSTKFVGGAAGRSHMLLVGSDGHVYGFGNNIVGQLGIAPRAEVTALTQITGPWQKEADTHIVQVSAGHTFSLFLTNTGMVYATGSSECGQLGNAKTGERLLKGGKSGFDIEVPPRLVQGLGGKKIVRIASGNQHSLAVDSEGNVYAWGYAGYCRLGLGDQKDKLIATLVPMFSGRIEALRGADVLCGPTSSVVIDRSGNFFIAGKWKLTGDGSAGQAYTQFQKIQGLQGCRTLTASIGGCTHLLTIPGPVGPDGVGAVQTVGFGQGCLYGELGIGSETKSTSKPIEIDALKGVDITSIAAGAFFTLFLARPTSALSDLTRWPDEIQSSDVCIVCEKKQESSDDPLMECERCEDGCHMRCTDPPLDELPEDDWFCPACTALAAPPSVEVDVPAGSSSLAASPTADKAAGAEVDVERPSNGKGGGNDDDQAQTQAQRTPNAKPKSAGAGNGTTGAGARGSGASAAAGTPSRASAAAGTTPRKGGKRKAGDEEVGTTPGSARKKR